jgi:hypothetical protein
MRLASFQTEGARSSMRIYPYISRDRQSVTSFQLIQLILLLIDYLQSYIAVLRVHDAQFLGLEGGEPVLSFKNIEMLLPGGGANVPPAIMYCL